MIGVRRRGTWARALVCIAQAFAVLQLATACKGLSDMTSPKPVATPVVTVRLSSEQVTLSAGSSLALQATAFDIDGQALSDRKIFWSSSDSTVAKVSTAGLVTAITTGTAQIAVSIDGRSAVARVTVTARGVASVQVTPTTPALLVGGFVQLLARTFDETGAPVTDRAILWGTSDPTIAVVDVAGLVTGIAPGAATVTATSESRSAAVGVTVSAVPVSTVQLTPTLDSVVIGQATQLTATPRDSTGAALTGRLITWTTNASGVATVSSSGLVLGVAPGTAIITASSGSKSNTSTILVRPRPVGAVILSPAQSALTVGQTVRLTVQITDGSGNLLTGRPVSFSSNNVNVAQVAVDGTVTVSAPGTAIITATSEGKTGTATVTVTPSPIATLRITPPTASLLVGGAVKLTATALDAGGNALGQRSVTWTSGAPSVVSVASDGTVSAIGAGTALVFAAAEGKLASATISVSALTPTIIQVTPVLPTVIIGDALDLVAVLRDAAGQVITGRTIAWTSSNSSVAVVSSTGRVRGVSPGSARIDATVDGVVGSTTVTVVPVPVATVTVGLGVGTLLVGQNTQASAVARDAAGNALTGRAVTWSSSNTAVATVASNGQVTAVALGTALVRATVESITGNAAISVVVGQPTAIAAVSATTQSATAGTAVTAPPSVRVTDAVGTPVAGVSVTFAVTAGSGTVTPANVSTNASGIATLTSWTLGATAGANTVTASVTGLTGSPVSFNATGTVGSPSTIAANSVVTQSATAGSVVASPPSVKVTDAGGNAVSGVVVTFTVTAGGGVTSPASPATVSTNASGIATLTSWTLGATVGANTVTAAVIGLAGSPVAFNASGTVGAPATIAANSLITQTTTAGSTVAAPPSVKVTDAGGNAVSGVNVTFTVISGGGSTSPASPAIVATNASGIATLTSWTVGVVAGANSLTAAVTGLSGSPVTFNASGTVGAAKTIAANSVVTQSATAGTAVAAPPSVKVTDAGGNPVSGVSVTFAVTGGGGSTSPASPAVVNTNASGIATLTTWTLGAVAGANTVTATASGLTGSPVAFTATGTVGAASALVSNSATTQSALVGTAVAAPPSVKVTDAVGNGVSGVSVTFTLASGGGVISPASPAVIVTNASGVATLTSWTVGAAAGPNTVSAAATGLTGSPITFTANGTAGAPTAIASNSAITQSATAGTTVAAPPSVKVTDVNGNPVSGVSVTFTVTAGAGTTAPASPATVNTNASGIATLTTWTLGATAGANTLTATATGLTGSPVTFNATGTVGAASAIVSNSVVTQSAAAGAAVAAPPSVKVTDAGGNGVVGLSVTFAVTVGGGTTSPASPATIVTNASGVATLTSWTLGAIAGANTLTATAAGLTGSPVTFNATGTVGTPTTIAAVSVVTQSAVAGSAVAAPPSVRVTDVNSNPVSGVNVTFAVTAGGGTLVPVGPAVVATNASGIATLTSWTLGTVAGANTVTATATGLTGSPVAFNATGTVGAATKLAIITQPAGAVSATVFTTQPVVEIRDANNNRTTSTAQVTVTIASGTGTLAGTTTKNAVNGQATFTDLKITGTGNHTLTFASAGLTSATSAIVTVTAGTPTTIAAASVTTQSSTAGTAVSAPPSVLVTDANGTPVNGVGVTFTVTAGGGTTSPVSPATVLTNASGIATLTSWTLGTVAGVNTITGAVTGLAGSPVTFNATGTVGAATTLTANSVLTQSTTIGTTVSAPPSVKVGDSNGNGVSGVSVVFAVTVGTGTTVPASPATVVTNASGIATLTSWTVGAVAGANSLTATASGLTGSPVTFNATGIAGAPTTISANSNITQSATAGTAVAAAPSVKVTDSNSNPVSGVNVTFTVTAGGGSTVPASAATVATNASGIATLTSWTLGATAGANTVTATAAGLTGSPVTFNATGDAGAASVISAQSVITQSATVSTAVAAPPSVKVADSNGNGVSGVSVTFTVTAGAGTSAPASPATVVTNASGIAALTSWTLGASIGTNTVAATATGLAGSPVTFNATGTAGTPTAIAALSTLTQANTAGTAVAAPPSVKVTDGAGNAVSGVNVTFIVTGGGGTTSPASPAIIATNASGIATLTSWTLGVVAGANTLTATATGLTGSPITFTATGTVGAATTIAATSAIAQSATVSTAVSAPPTVKVSDANGNGVSGVSVTFTVTAGGGTSSPASPATVVTNASGVAALTSWTLGVTAGTNTVTATATGLTGSPVTFNATGTAAAATTIAANSVVTQSATAGTTVAAPPSVKVTDGNNNPVSGVSVTFTVVSGGGSTSPVSPATVVTNASGIATLTSWTLGTTAGANSVSATATGLSGSPISFNATGVAGTATQLVITTPPSGAVSGNAFTGQPVIEIRDANGNRTTSTATVTASVASGSGSLGVTTTATAVNGVATFAGLTITGVGAHTLQFSTTTPALNVTSSSFTVSAGAATQLAITAQPASAVSGVVFSPQPTIEIRDANGFRTTSNASVTVALASGGGALSGTTTVTAVNGLATFTDLKIGGAGSHSLTFTSTGLTAATSNVFTVTQTPASLAVLTQPAGATSGQAFTTQPVVRILDNAGLVVTTGTGATLTVTAAVAAGGGTIGGAVTAAASAGIATFSTLQISGVGAHTLQFSTSAPALTVNSASFTVAAGAPTTIAANSVITQTATAGTPVAAPPSVKVTDVNSNPVSGVNVTFAVASGGGTIVPASPATIATNASGIATLTSWTLGATVGANSVTATATGLAGSPVTFSATGTVGAATQLVLTTPPSGAVSGVVFTGQPTVEIRDANGNLTTSTAAVTVVKSSGGGTLTGTTTVNAVNGVATFSDLKLAGSGAHALTFTSTGLTSAVSGSFTVTQVAASLSVLTQPSGASSGSAFTTQPVVRILDNAGLLVTTGAGATLAVGAEVATGGGTLGGGVSVNASGGVATFATLAITGSGAHTLKFSTTSPALSVNSASFAVGAVATTIAAISVQAQNATAGTAVAAPPSVKVTDGVGAAVSGVNVTFTVTAGGGSIVPASVATVATDASGIATLTSWTLGNTAGTNTVTAAVTGLTGSPVTFNATGVAGAATQLVLTAQPATAVSGVDFSTQPVIELRDVHGNLTNSTAAVTVSRLSGTATLSGTVTVNAVAGVATFAGLKFAGSGAHVLRFTTTTPALTVDGASFQVTQVATSLSIQTAAAGATAAAPFATQPVIHILDNAGLVITSGADAGLQVTVAVTAGPGALSGTATVTAVNGVATFSGLAISLAGVHTLQFTTAVPALSASQSLTVN